MMDNSAGPFESGSVPDGYREHLQPVIFEPWASRLIDFIGLAPGGVALDVASGTGVVARGAAARVGATGRVIASDISPAMLAHVAIGVDPTGAPVETLQCSATDLRLADSSVDVVLCQQGFPFISDRAAAAREMRRVLRAGGTAGVAVWLAGARLEPFETYAEVLRAQGVEEPFLRAFDTGRFKMSVGEVEAVLVAGGFTKVRVVTEELDLAWPSPAAAALGITGTPYAAALATLDPQAQRRLMGELRERFTDGDGTAARHVMTAVLGRASAT